MGLSRNQLWSFLELEENVMEPVVPPLLMAAYEHSLEREWRDGDKSPHGQPWFTSFHASQFPSDDENACGRRAVYGLLDPAPKGPITPYLQAWFDIGTSLEHAWVSRFRSYGVLVSADVTRDAKYQTGFIDEEHWLTGSCDAIVLPRGWLKSHLVEVKTTSHEKVLSMRSRAPQLPRDHGKYLRQLQTYIGLAHEMPFEPTVNICDESGAIIYPADDYICPIHRRRCAFSSEVLLPPDDGTLIYSSREEPLTTASFRVVYDPMFLPKGREKLAEWRDYFLREEIPPHVYEGRAKKWTGPACENCLLKPTICKPDYQDGVTDLAASHLIEATKEVRPDYDYEQKRSSVLFRWNAEDNEEEEIANVSNS